MADKDINIKLLLDTADSAKKVDDIKKSIDDLKAATDKLGNGEGVDALNKKIDELNTKLKNTGSSTEDLGSKAKELPSTFDKVTSSLGGVAKALGLAFAVDKVISFVKNSIEAFAKFEESTRSLSFAVKNVTGGNANDIKELRDAAEDLSNITFFTKTQITNAQALQAQFGLTAEEIKKLTPIIANIAVAQGTDLATATDVALRALEGQTKGLKTLGINFKDTGTFLGNYNLLIEKSTKLNGEATDALTTTAGALKTQEKRIEDLEIEIGENLAGAWISTKEAALDYFDKVLIGLKFIKNPLQFEIDQTIKTIDLQGKKAKAKETELFQDKKIWELQKEQAALNSKRGEGSDEEKAINSVKLEVINELIDARKKEMDQAIITNENITKSSRKELQNEIDILSKRSDANSKDVEDEIKRRQEAIDKIDKDEKAAKDKSIENKKKATEEINQIISKANDDTLKDLAKTEVNKTQAEYQAQLKRIDNIKATEKEKQEAKDAITKEYSALFIKSQEADDKKEDEETAKRLKTFEDDQSTYEKAKKDNLDSAIEAANFTYTKDTDNYKKQLDQKLLSQEQFDKLVKEAADKRDSDIDAATLKDYQDDAKAAKDHADTIKKLDKEVSDGKIQTLAQANQDTKDAYDAQLDDLSSLLAQNRISQEQYYDYVTKLDKKYHKQLDKNNADAITNQLQIEQKYEEGVQNLTDAIFSIQSDGHDKNSKAALDAAKKQFAINKALQFTQTLINGASAAVAAIKDDGFLSPLGIANFAASTSITIASLAKIAASQFTGGSSSSAGSTATPSVPSIVPQSLQAIGGSGQSGFNNPNIPTPPPNQTPSTKPQKIYVTSQDVTNSQNADAVLQRRASFK